MNNRRTIYAVSVDGNVSYVKGKGSLYLHSLMNHYEQLEPYINNKRGVYLLIGQGKAYIGEGDVFNRLTRHARNKSWVEEVYVFLRDEMLTKEDSLQYEGAIERYIRLNTDYDIDNKVKVRVNDIEVGDVIQAFKWMGLEVTEPKYVRLTNRNGSKVFTVKRTLSNTIKVETVHIASLEWLNGLEFKSIKDVQLIIDTLAGGV